MNATANPTAELPQTARRRFLAREKRPLLLGDWTRALFLHFEVPVDELRTSVPFDLDLWEDRALVSIVAFSMDDFAPVLAARWVDGFFGPLPTISFSTCGAYVRHNDNAGIYFISEWLDNRLSVMCGPGTFGLPYRFARIHYDHRWGQSRLSGRVGDGFAYTAEIAADASFAACPGGSLDEFLLERYTAFTRRGRCSRYFDIAHEPWLQAPVTAHIIDDRLLRGSFPWFAQARLVAANYSPGVQNVWMGAPRRMGPMGPMGR